MLELMAGKATVDEIARRLGVHASTVEGWRADALDGMTEAVRRGNGKTPRELELEKKADQLGEGRDQVVDPEVPARTGARRGA